MPWRPCIQSPALSTFGSNVEAGVRTGFSSGAFEKTEERMQRDKTSMFHLIVQNYGVLLSGVSESGV